MTMPLPAVPWPAAAATGSILLALAWPVPGVDAADLPIGGAQLGAVGVVAPVGGPALPAGISASAWLVSDASTGEVLAARHPHGRYAPASTLKVLTAVSLLPRLNPYRTIVVTNADETVDGTKAGFVPGLRVSVNQLFTALLVSSANDAANVLARVAGGRATALRWMAADARRLQALDTVPRTLHGLDAAGQSSSAYDLALLGRAGLAQPLFRRYVAIRSTYLPALGGKAFQIGNHNRLLHSYPGAIGIKNGHTDAAGSSLVAAARRGSRTVLVTLMHADRRMWSEAAALLDWGFQAAGRVAPVGTLVLPAPPAAAASPSPVATARPTAPEALPARTGGGAGTRTVVLGAAAVLLLAAAGLLLKRRRA